MKKFLLIIPIITFFFIISTFFYFLIIERDPSEVPSTLVKKKIPIFETTSLFEKQNFTSTNEFGYETTIVNFFINFFSDNLLILLYNTDVLMLSFLLSLGIDMLASIFIADNIFISISSNLVILHT